MINRRGIGGVRILDQRLGRLAPTLDDACAHMRLDRTRNAIREENA